MTIKVTYKFEGSTIKTTLENIDMETYKQWVSALHQAGGTITDTKWISFG